MTLKEIHDKINVLAAQARAVIDAADTEHQKAGGKGQADLTAEQSQQVDAINEEIGTLEDQAKALEAATSRRQKLADTEAWLKQSAGRQVASPAASSTPIAAAPAAPQVMFHGKPLAIPPGSRLAARATPEYADNFASYLVDGAIRAGMQTAPDTQGGYLAPAQMSMNLIMFVSDLVFMRQLATVLPPLTTGTSIGIPSWDTDPDDGTWTAEVPASDLTEDTAARVGAREMMPHLVTKLVKISDKLLRAAAINPEQLLLGRVGYKFAVTEEKAFLSGDGAQQPLGIFVASASGIPTSRDVTCASATVFIWDELYDMLGNLKTQYQNTCTWVVSRTFVNRCRKMKDSEGRYLWQPANGSNPATLVDRPFVQSEFAPSTFTASQYIAVLGDFKRGYWIVDSLDYTVQRLNELFALKNQIGYVARKETDGAPVLSECFSRLILSA